MQICTKEHLFHWTWNWWAAAPNLTVLADLQEKRLGQNNLCVTCPDWAPSPGLTSVWQSCRLRDFASPAVVMSEMFCSKLNMQGCLHSDKVLLPQGNSGGPAKAWRKHHFYPFTLLKTRSGERSVSLTLVSCRCGTVIQNEPKIRPSSKMILSFKEDHKSVL